MRYFINADDFGINQNRTEAIHQGITKGWIQKTSLIVNMYALDEALKLADENGYMDRLRFHLNLADGFPLTDDVRRTALCDKEGRFCKLHPVKIQLRCMYPRAIKAIRKEAEAQMKKYRDLGFASDYLDSHMWCMCNLPVWIAIKPLLKKYGFTTTRTMVGHRINAANSIVRLFFKYIFRLVKKELKINEAWCGSMGELIKAEKAGQINDNMLIELYVHPEFYDGVAMDNYYDYRGGKKPIEEIAAMVAEYGTLCGE